MSRARIRLRPPGGHAANLAFTVARPAKGLSLASITTEVSCLATTPEPKGGRVCGQLHDPSFSTGGS